MTKRMKTSVECVRNTVKGMVVMGMIVLGSATAFGKSHVVVVNNGCLGHKPHVEKVIVKRECNLRHIHDAHCGGKVYVDESGKGVPGMDKKLRKHIIRGKHNYNNHGVCRKCGMTQKEVRHLERRMGMR